MTGSTPRLLGDAMQSLLASLGIKVKLKRYEVLDRWPEIVGPRIAQVTKAEHIEGDRLFVSVTRSTWRNELQFLKKDLIEKINSTMEQELIKDIIFR